jgi:predicted phosphate transport protein (TIGR00153 family)
LFRRKLGELNNNDEVNYMKKDHIRTPILQTLRKSPFAGLREHFKFVKSGILAFEKTINFYIKGDYTNFKTSADKVYKAEKSADQMKGNIRNHLPKFIFIPIDKGDFLNLLKESDGILDTAEDVTVLLDMRKTKIPDEIKKDFQNVMKKAIETVNTLDQAMSMFKIMLETSFGGRTREDIKKVIHKIHKLEHESDLIEKQISKKIFNLKDLEPVSTIHLLKVTDRIGCIADHAENAGDMLRAMIAK